MTFAFLTTATLFMVGACAALWHLRWLRRLPSLDSFTPEETQASQRKCFCSVIVAPRDEEARLEEAVRRMTSLPASVFRLKDRGVIREGAWADLAVFYPAFIQLGFHTAYELDRVAGRYRELQQERTAPRTVFSLAADKPVNIFHLRQRYLVFSPLLDVEYGSATFVPASRGARYEVRVSTTGLLVREIPFTP